MTQRLVEFLMPAMPSINMAEMRSRTDLVRAGDGLYSGKGQVTMAGDWTVTVSAMKDGMELGTSTMTVTAK